MAEKATTGKSTPYDTDNPFIHRPTTQAQQQHDHSTNIKGGGEAAHLRVVLGGRREGRRGAAPKSAIAAAAVRSQHLVVVHRLYRPRGSRDRPVW